MRTSTLVAALAAVLLTVVAAGTSRPFVLGKDASAERRPADATTLKGRVMCGYQGWFRCPGDAAGMGWVHWSRDARRLAPETLTFEMWPDLTGFAADEVVPAPGFTHPDGSPASLFSSDHPRTVRRHFEWMRDHEIDGAWLQHFVVDLPGGTSADRYPSRRRVLDHVRAAATATGRVWALSFDIAGSPGDRIFDVLTAEWKRLVDAKIADEPRYLRHNGKPVVQIWGFFRGQAANPMTPDLANKLIDFFAAPGPYSAFLVGGGDWDWRSNPDPAWRAFYHRFKAYTPWNVGNVSKDAAGRLRASTGYWPEDIAEARRSDMLWIPVVYPGFSWDNLRRLKPGTSTVPRRGGRFYWEQFQELARLKVDSAYIAMFDEVDEGTAIFKLSPTPPTQARFVGTEGLPADWYLRLTAEGVKTLRGSREPSAEIPITP